MHADPVGPEPPDAAMCLGRGGHCPVPPAASSTRELAQIGRSRPGLEDDVRPFRSWFVCNGEPKPKGRVMRTQSMPESIPCPEPRRPAVATSVARWSWPSTSGRSSTSRPAAQMATASPRRRGRWRLRPRLERRPSYDRHHHRHRRAAGPPPPPPGTRLLRPPAQSHDPSLATRRIRGGCHRGLTGRPRTSWQAAARPHGALEATA